MRQMNYWLRRMGSIPGKGRPRDLSPEVVGDLAAIFRAREKCQSEIEAVLEAYSDGKEPSGAAYNKTPGESDW